MKHWFIRSAAGTLCFGFAILWLVQTIAYTLTLVTLSDYGFSQQSRRIVTETDAGIERLQDCLQDGVILYCDLGPRSNVEGVWMTEGAQTSLPVLEGSFLSIAQSQGTDDVAVVGKETEVSAANDGSETVQVVDERFAVTGTLGMNDVYSVIDGMIFVPLPRALDIFGSQDYEPEYVVDGPPGAVAATLGKMDEAGIVYTAYSASEEKISRSYLGESPMLVFAALLILICAVFCVFLVFEVRARRRRTLAVVVSGGTYAQCILGLLGKPLLSMYAAFLAGEVVALVVWNACIPQKATVDSFAYALITGAICIVAVALLVVLADRRTLWSDTRRREGADQIYRVVCTVFVCSVSVLLFFTNALWLVARDSSETEQHVQEISETTFLCLTSHATPEESDAFFMEPSGLERIKDMYADMESNPAYGFCSSITQPIRIGNCIEWPVEWYDKNTHSLWAMQVTDGFFEALGIEVTDGRGFIEDDYLAVNGDTIPVILGADYIGFFDIGSLIQNVTYLTREYTLEVVGFLPRGTIDVSRDMTLLDSYIIMPALARAPVPELYSDEWMQQSIIWNQKVQRGVYCLSDASSVPVVLSWIQSLTNKYGTYTLGALSIPQPAATVLATLTGAYATITRVLLIVVCAVLLILLMLVVRSVLAIKQSRYLAMKVSGASMTQLLGSLSVPILCMILGANGAALLAVICLTGQAAYSVWMVGLTSVGVLLVAVMYMYHVLRE